MVKKRLFDKAINLPETVTFSTGFPSLDQALGGGIILRSIVELFGDESEGKTTLGFQLLGKAQQEGYKTLFIDAEHATTREYLARFCDLEKVEFTSPISAEEVFASIRDFYEEYGHTRNMILVDSVAAMTPEREVEESSPRIAELAAIFSEQLRSTILSNYRNSIVVFTNQVRTKIDLRNPREKAEITPGGKALKFYAGYRLRLDTVRLIYADGGDSRESIGKVINIFVAKNKFGRPFLNTQLEMFFGEGFSVQSDWLNFAIKKGVVLESGGWYQYRGDKFHGRKELLERIKNDRQFFEQLRRDCSDPETVRKALV